MKPIEIRAKSGSSAEVLIYEDIGGGWMGGLTAKQFADDIKKLGDIKNIDVRIHSDGGNVFDGTAIYNTLKNHPAHVTVHIDGLAASIASVIAMAGDEIYMSGNGYMMIHDPWGIATGGSKEMRTYADLLDKVRDTIVSTYANRTGADVDQISSMMEKETWLTAQEAKDLGFVDHLTEDLRIAAYADISKYKNAPQDLIKRLETPRADSLKHVLAKMNLTLKKHKI